jgi:dTDP-glucose pyrophosphorylase
MKDRNIRKFCIPDSVTIRECMGVIDKNKQGIALVVNHQGRMIGTVTDGDIRRFILGGGSIDKLVSKVMWTNPLTAPLDASENEIRDLMNKYLVRSIPILDKKGRPHRVVHLRDLISEEEAGQTAVIMAGGEGRRLRPITEHTPKPMLKVRGKPIIERIISSFSQCAINNIYISINYKADVIEDYFKDGSKYGVRISYLKEKKKLGTVGALSLLPETPSKPLLVINGDVITNTNFLQLIEFHKQHRCVMTVAVIQYRLKIPYGVLHMAHHYLLGIEEKPQQKVLCNAGIYMINPEVLPIIPKDTEFNMTDFIKELARKGLPITTFPIHEHWIDIGQMKHLKKAQREMGD